MSHRISPSTLMTCEPPAGRGSAEVRARSSMNVVARYARLRRRRWAPVEADPTVAGSNRVSYDCSFGHRSSIS